MQKKPVEVSDKDISVHSVKVVTFSRAILIFYHQTMGLRIIFCIADFIFVACSHRKTILQKLVQQDHNMGLAVQNNRNKTFILFPSYHG